MFFFFSSRRRHTRSLRDWSSDVCSSDLGNRDAGPGLSGLRGNWWRIEIVMHNAAPSGPGTTFDMYIKNVTTNGPELHVLDTSQRSEERRVGKECRSQWSQDEEKESVNKG